MKISRKDAKNADNSKREQKIMDSTKMWISGKLEMGSQREGMLLK